ncbi:hypothetical protein C4K03_1376 [Pseudomonas synxantha]|uniref:Uncharacterized protein n=1 Tax=Pseudomonas synxantha TaxID=47883 RepID=A0A3G7U2J7_9PSED|nr:hypothetical protein [Pseudomonas synxantha]AZE53547.1 hypothetical protein C4K03_1376 [Pseudomonas synxantha]
MRAVIELRGAEGACTVVPFSSQKVTSKRKAQGVYEVRGTLGLIPLAPEGSGWGYSLGLGEKEVLAVVTYSRKVMTVKLQKDGQPYELVGAISLHCEIPESVPVVVPAL